MDAREIRLKRMTGDSRAVVVAFDHGLFDGPIEGMIDLRDTCKKINYEIDAVLLAPGMLRHCGELFAAPKRPLAIVRLNWNSVYCFKFNYRQAKSVNSYSVEQGLREGMDIALVSLTLQTGDEIRDAENVEVFSNLCNECHKYGIPVVGEYFPTGHVEMTPEQLHKDVLIGSRIVAELGADAIKTFYTCKFKEITGSCPVPILGLGAEKTPTQLEALKLAEDEVSAGAGGVVFGRNAIQISDPIKFQAALCDIVKNEMTAQQAVKKYELE
jgi:DhnA family fructose-bisphosphate aldolase class Ia